VSPFQPRGSIIGITIHYRGKIADLSRIEDLEDRVLDLSLDLGGQAQVWRSSGDADPGRVVRGLILNHAPGQESMSLLISPEGWLIGLMEIEDAEAGRLTEPPWCFVKTQFGSIEAHVALIEMLSALKLEFIPDLEVSDEGGYWEKRDINLLAKNFGLLRRAIDGMAEGLRHYGLSAEAAEDPEILIQRITRIAEKVRRSLGRPSEHAPPEFPEEGSEFAQSDDPEKTEAAWDEIYKDSRRRQERFQRLLEERLARGEDHDQAFEGAMEDAGIGQSLSGLEGDDDEADGEDFDWMNEAMLAADLAEDDEDSLDGSEPLGTGPASSRASESDSDAERGDDWLPDRDEHPLLERASQLYLQMHELFKDAPAGEQGAMHTLFQGAGDLCGGLAQAMSPREDFIDDRGLRIVQLKRALRGAAFARGALYNVDKSIVPMDVSKKLVTTLEEIEAEMFAELGRLRESL
jgi:hypothetical protein